MIAESGDFNVCAILAWMGDLSKERNIAKHAARQGLVCIFSLICLEPILIAVPIGIEYNATSQPALEDLAHRRHKA